MFSSILRDLRCIERDYWLMLMTLFLMKAGQFMLMPFLAIYLTTNSALTPAAIGFVIGSGPFCYGLAGIAGGMYVDRFGAKNAMTLSLFIGSIAIALFFTGHSVLWCVAMNIITGVTRAFFDIGSKSYGVFALNASQRRLFFNVRSMAVNSAAGIGPVIGAYFASINSLISFQLIGALYFLLGIVAIIVLKKEMINKNDNKKSTKFNELIFLLWRDTNLQLLVFISLIIWTIYAQLDSTLAEYLHAGLSNGIQVYSLLLIINAVGCVTLQLVVSHLTKNLHELRAAMTAMGFFAISYLILALFLNVPLLMVSAFLVVLAETIVVPLHDLLLMRIAPSGRVGTYYGIMAVAMAGVGIGPMIGGLLYQYWGAKTLFLLCGLSSVAIIYLYKSLVSNISTHAAT